MKYEDIFKIGVKAKVPAGTTNFGLLWEGCFVPADTHSTTVFDKDTEVRVICGCTSVCEDDEAHVTVTRCAVVAYLPLQQEANTCNCAACQASANEPVQPWLTCVPFDSLVFEA